MAVRVMSFDEVLDRLLKIKEPYHKNYLAMYSSWYGGITTDPALMMIPADDHLAHRGDGVFEVFKCVGRRVYNLGRHLDRIERSASMSGLNPPCSRELLVEKILATIRAAGVSDCLVRLTLSRGPGGFSASPYECPAPQIYISALVLKHPAREKYERGVKLKTTRVPLKQDFFATIKTCNYLPNVLMKKEADDAGADFPVSVDEQGFLGEGATENIGVITKKREFLVPRFDRILRGTTITRVMELAQTLIDSGELTVVSEADIRPEDAYAAAEVMMFGTTFDVLPVVDYDGRAIGSGRPGPYFGKLIELLRRDIAECREMSVPVEEAAHER